ncbi:Rz1-like lysis system protein LysC [Pseudomonas marincola]|uniref:Rz1-like lysis system protein LysC n=1 Tax=Pseudomonas marincola TaxID=437900 RepID=UPI001FCE20D7|nr:Rz1-like lysis system protein LysC [Pseudomonas marincola]
MLAACGNVPPSPAPTLIVSGCPAVVPCTLSPSSPSLNGELLSDTERTENDWATCAAQVDAVYACQQRLLTEQPHE